MVPMMFEATANEFPFVEALPKREKSKVLKAVDQLKDFAELSKQHGTLVPLFMVQAVLGVSKQRVYKFVTDGRLPTVMFQGHHFVTEDAIVEFAKKERKNGRPFKVVSSLKEAHSRTRAILNEAKKNSCQ